MRFYVGGDAGTIQGRRVNLTGWRMFSAGYGPKSMLRPAEVPALRAMLDSGAFSDPPARRLTPAAALARQEAWERRAAARWGAPFQAEAFVSYDRLIDETWVDGRRHKRRWSLAEADGAVAETVAAARYLAGERERLAPRRLVLSCQGVDAVQYTECAEAVLAHARPGDVLGLGGWCIIGRNRSWLPEFYASVDRVLPLAAAAGMGAVHLFGVLYLPALEYLAGAAAEAGLLVSTDSSSPVLNLLWSNHKKSGARAPTWEANVSWWQRALALLTGNMPMKRLKIDPARFGEAGDVRKAYSLGALQLSERAPIVRTAEIDGRHYTVTSLGMASAEAYELQHLHAGKASEGGEYAGRIVTRRGVEYGLHGPVRLVAAAEAPTASAENSAPQEEAAAVGSPPDEDFRCGCGALMPRGWDMCQSCRQKARVAEMTAETDAQIAAARGRVDRATPAQLAAKRTPLPPLGPDMFDVYVTPGGVGVVDISPRPEAPLPVAVIQGPALAQVEACPDPEDVQAFQHAQAMALDSGRPVAVVHEPSMAQVEAFPDDAPPQNAPEPPQAPATAAEEESAASGSVPLAEALTALGARGAGSRLVPVDRYPYDDIPVGWIVPSPFNPRAHIPGETLRELADSIKARGVLQPLRVRRLPDTEWGEPRYELVAGERRWHAAQMAGKSSVPVVLSSAQTEAEVRLEQLVENLQRADLSPLEVARGYQGMAELGMTQAQIAQACGKSQPVVANYLRLLDLPADVQESVEAGELSATHARALGRWDGYPEVQSFIARRAVETGATVRELETSPCPFADEMVAENLLPPPPKPRMHRPSNMPGSPGPEVGSRGGRAETSDAAAEILARRAHAAELRRAVSARIGPTDARAVAVVAEQLAALMPLSFVREALRQMGLPETLAEEQYGGNGVTRPALRDHLVDQAPDRVMEFCLRLTVERELGLHVAHAMSTPRCDWLAGREEGEAARACEHCGERIGAELDRCPLCGHAELGRGKPFAEEAVA